MISCLALYLRVACRVSNEIFVEGFRGFSAGDSPVLLSLLDDEQMRLLGEITDADTTHQIAAMVGARQCSVLVLRVWSKVDGRHIINTQSNTLVGGLSRLHFA